MRFEWDEAKRQLNLRRHRIDFVDAVEVFQVETVTVIDDRYEYGEMRFLTLGLVNGIVVAVSHTETRRFHQGGPRLRRAPQHLCRPDHG